MCCIAVGTQFSQGKLFLFHFAGSYTDQQAELMTTSRLVAAVFGRISPCSLPDSRGGLRLELGQSSTHYRVTIHKSLGVSWKLLGRVILGADPGSGGHLQLFL